MSELYPFFSNLEFNDQQTLYSNHELNVFTIQADRACGSSAHGQTDSQLNILLLLCSYICSTYYLRYVEYKYRSARKLDLMDTSNPPQADVDMNTATINVD
jgi:hypothetical protein